MSEVTMRLLLRVFAFAWGLFELFALLFNTGSSAAPVLLIYTLLPALALIAGAAAPERWTTYNTVKLFLLLLFAGAIVRRTHSIVVELLDTPPYVLAASLQFVTLAILVLLTIRVTKPMRVPITSH